ncbi:MAG: hypothetical protein ACOCV1_08745, partial [Bacillota bacterium]
MEKIIKTECITYPRSGHGILNKLLTYYFSNYTVEKVIEICNKEKYFVAGPYVYCTIYRRPDKSLDNNKITNFQKNHDFGLKTVIKKDRYYVIQIRNPIESIVSYFYWNSRRNKILFNEESWYSFFTEKAKFWAGFYKKWIKSDIENRFILEYKDLPNINRLKDLILFMTNSNQIDLEKLKKGLTELKVVRKNKLDKFPYNVDGIKDIIIDKEPSASIYFE